MAQKISKFELKKLLRGLEKLRGRHTELVSLYVPGDYNLDDIINFLTSERCEADNIKSKTTRKNVQSALEKIQRRLREVRELPKNGVALFCGNVSEVEGKTNLNLWEIVPPTPITSRIYRCDKTFVLEPLKDMVRERKIYGLVSIDRSEGTVAYLKGKTIDVVKTLESNVPGKIKAGGQSQARFARIREGLYETFLSRIAEICKNAFLEKLREGKIKGLIVGGPGFAKDDLVENYLHEELKDRVLNRISTNYAGEDGLNELMYKLKDVLADEEVVQEKALVNEFFENLKKGGGKATYGLMEVIRALKMGAIEKLLVSETLEIFRIKLKCSDCAHEVVEYLKKDEDLEKIKNQKCKKCGGKLISVEEENLMEYLEEKCEEMGTSLYIISTETPEGQRLEKMGSIAAILRYGI